MSLTKKATLEECISWVSLHADDRTGQHQFNRAVVEALQIIAERLDHERDRRGV